MANKHFVVLPNERKATRTSANRTYTHLVAVGPAPKADRLSRVEMFLKADAAYVARLTQDVAYLVNGGKLVLNPENSSFASQWRMVDNKLTRGESGSYNDQVHGKGIWLDTNTTDEAEARSLCIAQMQKYLTNAQKTLANREAELAEIQAQPEFLDNAWWVAGWCGRLDLAQKLAAKNYGTAEVRILEAQTA
jgi:hypothetical protein